GRTPCIRTVTLCTVVQEETLTDFPCRRIVGHFFKRHLVVARIDGSDALLKRELFSTDFTRRAVALEPGPEAKSWVEEEHAQTHNAQPNEHHRPPARDRIVQFGQITVPDVTGIFDLINFRLQPCPLREQQDETENHPANGVNRNPVAPEATYKIVHGSS